MRELKKRCGRADYLLLFLVFWFLTFKTNTHHHRQGKSSSSVVGRGKACPHLGAVPTYRRFPRRIGPGDVRIQCCIGVTKVNVCFWQKDEVFFELENVTQPRLKMPACRVSFYS